MDFLERSHVADRMVAFQSLDFGEEMISQKQVALIAPPNYEEVIRGAAAVDEARVLKRAFGLLGVELSIQCFNDPTVKWSSFDAVLPKTAWNYFNEPLRFAEWLDHLADSGIQSINPVELIRWNHDKAYLADLRDLGVRVAPFELFVAGTEPGEILDSLAGVGWQNIVIKPSISGAAQRTSTLTLDQSGQIEALSGEILSDSGLILQPFFDEIPNIGEWSIFFIDGEITHSVLKVPKSGDFRCQEVWGAHTERQEIPRWIAEAAKGAIEAAPMVPTYGRVDGFVRDGEFNLMELELIEPYFYFEHAPQGTVGRFARAIVSKIET
ncbi:RimK family alpha-L-glutamate ligase [Streptomyces sp. R11]|uniref:RimK family alpha-L-glutamate ligase n=1 Tax=Streptomyces sp. R11 TaxID=3238625 RepID=A0AB39NBW1_9ACTN